MDLDTDVEDPLLTEGYSDRPAASNDHCIPCTVGETSYSTAAYEFPLSKVFFFKGKKKKRNVHLLRKLSL